MSNTSIKILADNRKARFNYAVEESLEVGIELKGTEVKSMRAGKFSFTDSFAVITNDDELVLQKLHISAYDFGNRFNHEPDRHRKLLAHKAEIIKLRRKVDEKGMTLIPLKFYLKGGRVKLELGICKGKKLHDKRESIKSRDVKRDLQRDFKGKF